VAQQRFFFRRHLERFTDFTHFDHLLDIRGDSAKTLLRRLKCFFGVSGMILNWISSYLHDRHQYVQLGRHRSSSVLCGSGVPRGGVLSALLFIAYVAPVGDVISGCGVNYHQYADDTQLFIAVRTSKIQSELSVIEFCSTLVQQLFAINELLLNPDKSEVIFFGTSTQLKSAAAVNTVTGAGSCLQRSTGTPIHLLGAVDDPRRLQHPY
jgi:Reverse transcriptase (RNA-dependent DNA polymerase)